MKNQLPKIKFENIEQIINHVWIGNAYHDMPAFDAIDEFVLDTNNSLADKAKALRTMCECGMGLDPDEQSDEDLLQEYLNSLQ
jgi:hypothetical protein